MSKRLKSFLTSLVIGALITVGVVYLNRNLDYGFAQRLSDGFFVSAVLLLGCGGLVFSVNNGVFDAMSYSIKTTFHIHYPGANLNPENEKEDFATYRSRKQKGRKPASGILLAGLIYLVLASIMLTAYFFV